jgi:hypothetical protein
MAEIAPDIESARAAKAKALKAFRSLANVNGIGLTRHDGEYAVKVNLKEPSAPGDFPEEIDGVPVVTRVVGKVRKQSS